MRSIRTLLPLLLISHTNCPAQQLTAFHQPSGTVTGHVFCSDTRLPARIASVVLQPVVDLTSPALRSPDSHDGKSESVTTVTQTLLDGSFTIPNVHPGNYYVIAEKLGYLSPLAQLSRADLNHPDKAAATLMADLLTPVTVVANRTSTVEVRLLKGASISGVVRFDDGAAAVNSPVSLLRADASGKWSSFRSKLLAGPFGQITTDDGGHYRLVGLPAGKYLVKATLEVDDVVVNHVFNEGGSSSSNTRYSLDIYSGGAIRQRDAKSVDIADGEDSVLPDIEIPLSKLHAVSGSVLEAETGGTVNAAHIAIVYTDDKTQLVSTEISKDDNSFHLLYVPEGEYTLSITNAREVTRFEVPTCPQCVPPTHTEEKTLRSFGDADQPLVIHSDVNGLLVSVPPKSSK